MNQLDMAEVIVQTEFLSAMIASSDIAEAYRTSKHEMEIDPEVTILIKDFTHKKNLYEEVARFGKYHPDYLRIRREVFECKRNLEKHPVIAKFKDAEKELEELLYEISQLLAVPISENIKVPGTNPFFSGKGCSSGGCGPGGCSGGCG